ncbi:DUF3789 domain-containing protein [Desulforamulus aquiferis]|uniref:DUF3789 domain-containing protein n=1 Tax=Desulforamulus aquiferis TaxID=1397668 RepID=A0AAW7ZBI9_9FIRM|nr:DUF3789 domain-containing protein [Desulforamulus aquiferis]MDO7786524.1 DUF3789 domain-containing protein [Desulforamulus aquiferis]RYD03687.1 hypothetical protein N752_18235 [Desulforamulus aquiferis]
MGFIAGVFVGAFLGILTTCLLVASRETNDTVYDD